MKFKFHPPYDKKIGSEYEIYIEKSIFLRELIQKLPLNELRKLQGSGNRYYFS